MPSARVGIVTHKSGQSASAQSAHILREHGSINGNEPKIIIIKKAKKDSFSNPEKMDPDERRRLRKKYQKCMDRAKVHRANNNIPTAERNEAEANRIKELLDSTKILGKNHVKFVEFQLAITDFPPDEIVGNFISKEAGKFIEEFFGEDVELISGATHLDQKSIHSHMMVKPAGDTWTNICEKHGGYQEAYLKMTEAWNKQISEAVVRDGISVKIKEIEKGTSKNYVELPQYKQMMKEVDSKRNRLYVQEKEIESKLHQVQKAQDSLNESTYQSIQEMEKKRIELDAAAQRNYRFSLILNKKEEELENKEQGLDAKEKSIESKICDLDSREKSIKIKEIEIDKKSLELDKEKTTIKELLSSLVHLIGEVTSINSAIDSLKSFLGTLKDEKALLVESVKEEKETMSDEEFKRIYTDRFADTDEESIFGRKV